MTSATPGTPPFPPTPLPGEPDEETSADRRFLGHPLALANLFGVETWERFSFYGMQSVMTLYLYFAVTGGGLGFPKASATSIVGAYAGMVYLACVLGAFVADRVLGAERTLFVAAITVMAGHIALAVLPGIAGVAVGLSLVALGSGAVKTSATTVVGSLYRRGDRRVDAGFTLFYMGVNIGALVGPLVTGFTQKASGSFHLAFGLAAIGMAIGLTQYALTRRNLPPSAGVVPDPLPAGAWRRPVVIVAVVAVLVALLFVTGVLTAANLSTAVALVVALAAIGLFVLLLSARGVTDDERSRVRSFIPMWLASVVFWTLFQQQFSVLELYSDSRMDRHLGSLELPITVVNSMEPFFVIIFAPLFAALWTRLGKRQPSTPTKFVLGAGGMGVAFLLFLPFADGGRNTVPALGVAGILAVFALAELNLSPVGLALSTRIAPALFRNQMVALNYLNVSLGSALAGTLAGFYSTENEVPYFGILGGSAIVLALVLAALRPWIRRAMRGVA